MSPASLLSHHQLLLVNPYECLSGIHLHFLQFLRFPVWELKQPTEVFLTSDHCVYASTKTTVLPKDVPFFGLLINWLLSI